MLAQSTGAARRPTEVATLLAIALAILPLPACGQARAGERQEMAGERDVNLAAVAKPTSSYVSPDTSLSALNDGFAPASSQDRRQGSYGNWPRRGIQWVQYEWPNRIATNKIAVYWWDDRRGVRLPKACRLLFWDGQRFLPVRNAKGLGVQGDRFNLTAFDEVRTDKLRLEIVSQDKYSTGILEWRVCDSGHSPPLPPLVHAGPDRMVALGAKTYLGGAVKVLPISNGALKYRWHRVCGPGNVAFANEKALQTTATFGSPGRYRLELTAAKGELVGCDSLTVKVFETAAQLGLESLPAGRWQLDSPLWSERIRTLIAHWIPHCIRKISDPALPEGGLNNFIEAANKLAGRPHGKHRGPEFANAWVYNTIEAICYALMLDPQGDPEIQQAQQLMRRTLQDWIPKILAAQEPDGYIQTAFTLNGWPRWSPTHRWGHEGYVAGYFLEAAIAHYLASDGKDRRLYDAARRLADCWCRHIGPPPKRAWYDGHQGMELALVRFGRFVNQMERDAAGDRYIRLAKFLLDCRGGGTAYDQSHLPVVRQYEAVGHAVRATYQYTAMAQLSRQFRDPDYISATMSLWDSLVNRKYYVTGGIGSGQTPEGFGPDYSLPHRAYCESCSSCGLLFFQHELHLLFGQARFADLYEDTLSNALLGSIDLAGRNFFYPNPLDCRRRRYPWHPVPCCVGNIPRTLLRLPQWTYSRGPAAVYVNLFVGSTVTVPDVAGTDVRVLQGTRYPWSGEVTIELQPARPARFSLAIRSPQREVSELYRAEPAGNGIEQININGERVSPPVRNGYVLISRLWQPGDRVKLQLPMPVQRVRAIRRVEACRGQVALRRGPLIYTFESADQTLDQPLPPATRLTAQWQPDLLHGLVLIGGRWPDGSQLTAIPYYARANRAGGNGQVRSTVWVREK